MVILMATAAVFAVKIAGKNSTVSSTPVTQNSKSVGKAETKAGDAQPKVATQTDPDAKAMEDDLNSVSDEDFSDSSLSDQNVGL